MRGDEFYQNLTLDKRFQIPQMSESYPHNHHSSYKECSVCRENTNLYFEILY
jgi:hypothetical protein